MEVEKSHKIQREISGIEERDQGEGGGEEVGKSWGMILAKLYSHIACMYEYVTTNTIIMYNHNLPIKKIWEKKEVRN